MNSIVESLRRLARDHGGMKLAEYALVGCMMALVVTYYVSPAGKAHQMAMHQQFSKTVTDAQPQ